MRKIKSGKLWGLISITGITLSTICCFIPIFILGLFKLIPHSEWRIRLTKLIDKIIHYWILINNGYINKIQPITWDIIGDAPTNPQKWHLVVANHQSWVDIFILQKLLAKKIPIMKFFVKDSLKWIPILGFVWWAMGCPFMKRYSSQYLKKKPHKRGKDIATTKKAMQQFKKAPVSIANFVEGTRFTSSKKDLQQSPYEHLLKPKAGGISFSVNSMAGQISSLLDVTIIYPHKQNSFWDFLCHRIDRLKIIIREIPIPSIFLQGNLLHDEEIKARFHDWLNQQWEIKDSLVGNYRSKDLVVQ